MSGLYDDIIHLEHPEPKNRKRMSMIDRAAQFSPFAALTGYDAVIREEARLTDRAVELAPDGTAMLDEKLRALAERIGQFPEVRVTCFQADDRKCGGAYRSITSRVKRLDRVMHLMLMEDGTVIPFDQILDVAYE